MQSSKPWKNSSPMVISCCTKDSYQILPLQHQSILRFCRERGLMADVEFDMKMTDRIEDLLETVKGIAADPEVSVDEAFYAALLMESSELEDVYEKLTGGLVKDHGLLFDAIHASLGSHHSA